MLKTRRLLSKYVHTFVENNKNNWKYNPYFSDNAIFGFNTLDGFCFASFKTITNELNNTQKLESFDKGDHMVSIVKLRNC